MLGADGLAYGVMVGGSTWARGTCWGWLSCWPVSKPRRPSLPSAGRRREGPLGLTWRDVAWLFVGLVTYRFYPDMHRWFLLHVLGRPRESYRPPKLGLYNVVMLHRVGETPPTRRAPLVIRGR
jgi:hypothetical protein